MRNLDSRRNRAGFRRLIGRGSRGQSAIELALLAPLLGLVLLAAADFARMFFMVVSLNNAARAGVQYGAQSAITAADMTGMQTAAHNDDPSLQISSINASQWCDCPPGGNPYDCPSPPPAACVASSEVWTYIEVQTQGTFTTLINYPGIPHSIALTGKAIMRSQ
ncbi:MAG TPA: TadE/TadG family type IV pilus assembly protein [Candidatus Binataceae bacterium]|nr:TadE/TadG family type IV pilus assembly protein [Candidatus Binataceae bacterium]